jgi:hypothetical protein
VEPGTYQITQSCMKTSLEVRSPTFSGKDCSEAGYYVRGHELSGTLTLEANNRFSRSWASIELGEMTIPENCIKESWGTCQNYGLGLNGDAPAQGSPQAMEDECSTVTNSEGIVWCDCKVRSTREPQLDSGSYTVGNDVINFTMEREWPDGVQVVKEIDPYCISGKQLSMTLRGSVHRGRVLMTRE